MRLGVFGGSFDPPHVGHLTVCALALSLTDVDELLVIPCYEHPFGKRLSGFEHRLRMCELAFGDLSRLRVSDLERQLGGPSLTVRTLSHLASADPGGQLVLVIGADAIRDREGWHSFDEIERLARVVVFGRSGVAVDPSFPTLPSPPAVAASEIRAALAAGADVSGVVPRPVLRYIAQHGLYRV